MSSPHLRYKYQTRRERTWTIHFIALEKLLKGTVVVVLTAELLTFLNDDIHAWAVDFVDRHSIDVGNRFVQWALTHLVGVGDREIVTWSVIAVLYSSLLFVEGLGLWFQKRWAEYLTAIGTGLLIPVELYEIFHKFTWLRVGIFVINSFIVWYLVTRLKDEKTVGGPVTSAAEARV